MTYCKHGNHYVFTAAPPRERSWNLIGCSVNMWNWKNILRHHTYHSSKV